MRPPRAGLQCSARAQRPSRQSHARRLALAEQGRALIGGLQALTGALPEVRTGIAGTLRLSTSATLGRQYASPLLPEFLSHHPKLKISVDLSDQRQESVAAGFGLSIRIGALDDSSLVARRLSSNPRVLSRRQCLLLAIRSGRNNLWRFTAADGREISVQVDSRIDCHQGELLRDAAVAGLGIAMHSTWHICDDRRSGRLQVVLSDDVLPDTGIHALMPQRRLVPPRVRAFVDIMAEKLGGMQPWERDPDRRSARSAARPSSPQCPPALRAGPHPELCDHLADRFELLGGAAAEVQDPRN